MERSQNKAVRLFIIRFIALYGILFIGIGAYSAFNYERITQTSIIDIYLTIQYGIWLLISCVLALVLLKAVGYCIIYSKDSYGWIMSSDMKFTNKLLIAFIIFLAVSFIYGLIENGFVIMDVLSNLDERLVTNAYGALFLITLLRDMEKNRDIILRINI